MAYSSCSSTASCSQSHDGDDEEVQSLSSDFSLSTEVILPLPPHHASPETTTLPIGSTARQSIRRLPSKIRNGILSLRRDDYPGQQQKVGWEELEDDLYIILNGRSGPFRALQALFFDTAFQIGGGGTTAQQSQLLRSMAYLLSETTKNDMRLHDEHVSRLSNFFLGRESRDRKLATIKALLRCLLSSSKSPICGSPEAALTFLTTRQTEWPHDRRIDDDNDDGDVTLLYELRALCIRRLELEEERIRRVSQSGDEAAVLIVAGAKLVELGIHKSNRALENKIGEAGKLAKQWVDVDEKPLILDRDAVVAMAFSDAAKKASEYAREGSKAALETLLDASISGLHMVGHRLMGDADGGDSGGALTDSLSRESREILKAAVKVGMATVGAAALVGEAMVDTGRCVASKTACVTAEVVGHKYGETAGEVVKNAGETAGNLARAAGNVALLDAQVLAKHVAKSAGKAQANQDVEEAKQAIQKLEKSVSFVVSTTLGIQIQGNWTKEIESFSEEASDLSTAVEKATESDVSSVSIVNHPDTLVELAVSQVDSTQDIHQSPHILTGPPWSDAGSTTSTISTHQVLEKAYVTPFPRTRLAIGGNKANPPPMPPRGRYYRGGKSTSPPRSTQ